MGPIPGKKPKNVGERPALNCRRLPCCTHCPPVNWLRIRELPCDVRLTIEKPGDHVIDGVMFTGDGVRLTLGKFCVTRPLPISWRRLPPMLSVPQSNCLLKLICEPRLAVARYGLTVLFWITVVLVA